MVFPLDKYPVGVYIIHIKNTPMGYISIKGGNSYVRPDHMLLHQIHPPFSGREEKAYQPDEAY